MVTDACIDLRIERVAPGRLEEPENRLIGEGRRVGEIDCYLSVVEDCVDTNARDRLDACARRGCPGNDGESRLAGGNVKAMVDEAGSRGGLGCSASMAAIPLLHDDGASHVRVYGAVVRHRAGSVEGMGVGLAARHRR